MITAIVASAIVLTFIEDLYSLTKLKRTKDDYTV
jgi:hypothetical protein